MTALKSGGERRTVSEASSIDVWVLEDGAWRCVSGHASVIPTKP